MSERDDDADPTASAPRSAISLSEILAMTPPARRPAPKPKPEPKPPPEPVEPSMTLSRTQLVAGLDEEPPRGPLVVTGDGGPWTVRYNPLPFLHLAVVQRDGHSMVLQRGPFSRHWSACAAVTLSGPVFAGLELRPEARADRVVRALGRPEAQTGDPAFDDAVWVARGAPSALLGRFDHRLRGWLTQLIGRGATLYQGTLTIPVPLTPMWDLLPPALDWLDGFARAPLDLAEGLAARMAADPIDGVRVCAAKAWIERVDPNQLPADEAALESLCIALLDLDEHRAVAIDRLARIGTERAVAPLMAIASSWFGGAARERARQAVESIVGRTVLRTGGLSVVDSRSSGGLSLERQPTEPSDEPT